MKRKLQFFTALALLALVQVLLEFRKEFSLKDMLPSEENFWVFNDKG